MRDLCKILIAGGMRLWMLQLGPNPKTLALGSGRLASALGISQSRL